MAMFNGQSWDLTEDDMRNAEIYISRPDLCNIRGCIEWIEALLSYIQTNCAPMADPR